MSSNSSMKFKVIVAGDGGVGKTALLNRYSTGDFGKSYTPTLGADVHTLRFNTNYGVVVFDCWDTAGQDKFSGLADGYFIGAHGAIAMFDLTSKSSYLRMPHFIEAIRNVAPDVPIVACGNKSDLVSVISAEQKRDLGLQYYDTSARSNYNYDKPFLYLARKLTGYEDLVFD